MVAKATPKTAATTSKAPAKRKSGGGGKKKLTPYNKFMKSEIGRLKETKPDSPHTEIFKLATSNWATSKENPKNK